MSDASKDVTALLSAVAEGDRSAWEKLISAVSPRPKTAIERMPYHDGLVAIRTGGDHVDRPAGELLDLAEVGAGIFRQRIVARQTNRGFLPAGQFPR